MPNPGVYGPKAERLARLAVLERSEKDIKAHKETSAPPLTRLALAVVGGVFLWMARGGAVWAWLGAVAYMLSLCGAKPAIGLFCGAITAGLACFRILDCYHGQHVFWLILCLQTMGGALAGVLIATISRRLPPQAFPFLAALLPAGLEHLWSFGALGALGSTALTQYEHPVIVCMGRLGGLPGVTYFIFLFGGAVAAGVRFIGTSTLAVICSVPATGLVLLGSLYGALSSSREGEPLQVVAFAPNNLQAEWTRLVTQVEYDSEGWNAYTKKLLDIAARLSGKQTSTTAMEKQVESKGIQVVVWPEAATIVDSDGRIALMKQVGVIARNNKCVQAFGFYDRVATESAAIITDETGEPQEVYVRRRFVPGTDDTYVPKQIAARGTAAPEAINTFVGKAGIVLSLDANHFENFRSIAKSGGRLVCVAGLDDKAVPQTSLPLLAFNAALSGTAVVRAAKSGLLVAIDPDGKIVERESTAEKSHTQIIASLRLGNASTVFLLTGNLFAWLALLAGVAAGLYASSLPAPPEGPVREQSGGYLSYKTKEGVRNI